MLLYVHEDGCKLKMGGKQETLHRFFPRVLLMLALKCGCAFTEGKLLCPESSMTKIKSLCRMFLKALTVKDIFC